MTKQETFDTVVAHLRQQNEKSVGPVTIPTGEVKQGMNRYRGLGGLKCAVGCLIPDDEYRQYFEDMDLDNIIHECKSLKRHDRSLLKRLSTVHDWFPVERWEIRLGSVASKYNLKYTAPEKASP